MKSTDLLLALPKTQFCHVDVIEIASEDLDLETPSLQERFCKAKPFSGPTLSFSVQTNTAWSNNVRRGGGTEVDDGVASQCKVNYLVRGIRKRPDSYKCILATGLQEEGGPHLSRSCDLGEPAESVKEALIHNDANKSFHDKTRTTLL